MPHPCRTSYATPLRVVIAGGSGQIGQVLSRDFVAGGHDVTVLARPAHRPQHPWRTIPWDGRTLGMWVEALEGADLLINLAGRSVNCRYTARNRRDILDSRVLTTRLLGEALGQITCQPGVWMNASTATIYRHALDRPMDERTGELGGGEPGAPETWRFSIQVALAWEEAFFGALIPSGIRRIALRSAMTMTPDPGGVFDVLYGLVRVGLGGSAGSGTQFVSWIHEYDFLRAVQFLYHRQDISGPVNLVSPNPLPNRDFMTELRAAASRAWFGLPAAKWMLECGAVLLNTETELVLKSRRVVPGRLLDAGFQFCCPNWSEAARDLVSRRKALSD